MRFQAIGEPVPGNQSPFTGCNSKLVIIIKANAETRKMIMNFVLEIFILLSCLQITKVLCNSKLWKISLFPNYFEKFSIDILPCIAAVAPDCYFYG